MPDYTDPSGTSNGWYMPSKDKNSGAVSLGDVFAFFWRRKVIILGASFCFFMLMIGVILSIRPQYTASAVVRIDPKRLEMVTLQSGLLEDKRFNAEQGLQNAIQDLQSQELVFQAVEALDLEHDENMNPALVKRGLIGSMLHNVVIDYHDFFPDIVKDYLIPRYAPELTNNLQGLIAEHFLRSLKIAQEGKSQNVTVSIQHQSAQRAADIASTYAKLYVQNEIRRRADSIMQASGWISARLSELNAGVKSAEEAVETYKLQNRLVQGTNDRPSVQRITEISTQLTSARGARDEAISKLQQADIYLKSGQLASVQEVQLSPLIQQLRTQETEVRRKLASLSETHGEKHPVLIQVRSELQDIRQKIAIETQGILQTLRNTVAVGNAQVIALSDSLEQAKTEVGQENENTIQLRVLERNANHARMLLDAFLAQAKLTTERNLQVSEAQVLAQATLPNRLDVPNLVIMVLIAGVFSVGSGIVLGLLRDRRNGFRSMEEIEPQLGIPALALIPQAKNAHKLPVGEPRAAFVESLRQLYTTVMIGGLHCRVILITSSVSEEGKTTVAVALSRMLAQAGQNVVLIDCDLRHPNVHNLVQIPNEEGLIDVLTNKAQDNDIIVKDPKTPMFVVPAGRIHDDSAFQLGSHQFRNFIERLKVSFDTIILDSAPLIPVSDTKLVARLADKTIMIIRWEHTKREVVRLGVKFLMEAGADLAGVAINRVLTKQHATYGFSDSGLYQSRHRKYFRGTNV